MSTIGSAKCGSSGSSQPGSRDAVAVEQRDDSLPAAARPSLRAPRRRAAGACRLPQPRRADGSPRGGVVDDDHLVRVERREQARDRAVARRDHDADRAASGGGSGCARFAITSVTGERTPSPTGVAASPRADPGRRLAA